VPVDPTALADDLRAETRWLESLLDPLDSGEWDTPTPAPGWSIRDQISHLAYFDEAATRAATQPDAFRAERDQALADDFTEGIARQARTLPAADVYAWFERARDAMIVALLALDPSTRVPWYGPDMSIASSLTARIMETWAHGQDVADALDADHPPTGALRHVAHLGVRTLGYSFTVRGLDVPDAPVFVSLIAAGEPWTWGDPGVADRVEGAAGEFCLVVTQRRNVADTQLRVEGQTATQWMQIAQAFAGPPGPGR
jgi:uncharacterized protein (TIGR03084 family)